MTIDCTYLELITLLAQWIINNAINVPARYNTIPNEFLSSYSQRSYPNWVKGINYDPGQPGGGWVDKTGGKPYVLISYLSGALPQLTSTQASQSSIENLIKTCLTSMSFNYNDSVTLNGLKRFLTIIMSFCSANITFRNSFLYSGRALICYEATSSWTHVNIDSFGNDDLLRAIATKTLFDFMISHIIENSRFIPIKYTFAAGRE